LLRPGSSTTSQYNANDSLSQTTSAAGTQTDTYDADGRLESDTCTTYQYDGFGQTASAVAVTSSRPTACGPAPASTTTTTTYDALGRVVTEQDGNGYWDDHYSSMGSEVALIQKGQAGSGGVVGTAENDLSLLLGSSGIPSQVANLTGSGGPQWYTNDGQGNVGTVTGSATNGAATCVLKYDIYGSPVQTTSSSNPCVSAATSATELTELGYQFAQRDATTGDYTFGSRTYDPKKAAFTTPDAYHPGSTAQDVSIGSDPLTADTYVYANANPINLKDPAGHDPCDNSPDPASCRAAGGDAGTDYADAYSPTSPSDPACTNSGCEGEQQVATAYDQAATQAAATAILQSTSACQNNAGCSGEMQAIDPGYHEALLAQTQAAGGYLTGVSDADAATNAALAAARVEDQVQGIQAQFAALTSQVTACSGFCPGQWVSSAEGWAGAHAGDIAGVAVGVGVFFGCTALTAGVGAIGCAALSGALGSALGDALQQQQQTGQINWGQVGISGVLGGLGGAASGGIGVGVGSLLPRGATDGGITITASDGADITGFKSHGIDRVIGDGAGRAGTTPQAILNAFKNPNSITEGVDDLGRPFKIYTGNDARVVINPPTGQVVSVNPMSGAGASG
jgi:RHS repeat-associated protein